MKVAILAGGLGTRLAEETTIKPKPMVEIGNIPILLHIMKIYSHYGYNEFILALGYKGNVIKDYFINYRYHASSLSIDLKSGYISIHKTNIEDWKIHLIDTGLNTQTGGRIKKILEYCPNEPMMLTYGDGVANIVIPDLIQHHKHEKKMVTVSAVRPPARFGEITMKENNVVSFNEKPQIKEGWINGGFFIIEPEVSSYIINDDVIWEKEPLETLAREGQLAVYKHHGFWQCVDTLRDVRLLENLWQENDAPWKLWE